jgi:hypothetical protein
MARRYPPLPASNPSSGHDLPLADWPCFCPVEWFGQNRFDIFPDITGVDYLLRLAVHFRTMIDYQQILS